MSNRVGLRYFASRHGAAHAGSQAVDPWINPGLDGYALVHAGRQLLLGPIAFWIMVGTLVIMAAWTVVANIILNLDETLNKR